MDVEGSNGSSFFGECMFRREAYLVYLLVQAQHLYLQTVPCLLRCLGGLASGLERYLSAVHVSWGSARVRYVYYMYIGVDDCTVNVRTICVLFTGTRVRHVLFIVTTPVCSNCLTGLYQA